MQKKYIQISVLVVLIMTILLPISLASTQSNSMTISDLVSGRIFNSLFVDSSHSGFQNNQMNLTVSTCGIELNQTNATFGQDVGVNVPTIELNIKINNTGNYPGIVNIYGTNWTGTYELPVNRTAYSNQTGTYDAKERLDIISQILQSVLEGYNQMVAYIQFKALTGDNRGNYSQEITFSVAC